MTKRLPKMEDIPKIRYLGDLDCCGSRAAWTVSFWDTSAPEGFRRFVEQIETAILDGAHPVKHQRITAGGKSEHCPRVMADGSVLFLSDAGLPVPMPEVGTVPMRLENEFYEQRQLCLWKDGRVRVLTALRHGVEQYLPAPDGSRILLLSWQYGSETEEQLRTPRTVQQMNQELEQRLTEPFVTESPRFKSDAEMGYRSDRKLQMWLWENETLRLLQAGSFSAPCWTPDGKTILFQCTGKNGTLEFKALNPVTEEISILASVCNVSPCFEEHTPVFAKDRILFAANEPGMEYADPRGLYAIPLTGGADLRAERIISRDADIDGILPQDTNFLSRSFGKSEFCTMPDRTVCYVTGIEGDVRIACADALGADQVPVLCTKPLENYHSLHPMGQKHVLTVCALPDRLPVLAAVDIRSGDMDIVYDPNPEFRDIAFQAPESIRTASGTQGFYLAPINATGKAPTITFCHGGPTGFFCSALNYELQALAAAGYGVLYPNPRGGTGFGRERNADHFAYDGSALKDIEEFTDTVCALHPELDPARAGVCGGSYGGFLTLYAAVHSTRFRAACAHRALADIKLIAYASHSAGGSSREEFPVFSDYLKNLQDSSVSALVDQIRIPLRLLYSETDANCIPAQGFQMLTARKAMCPQIPCDLILYPDSCHGLHSKGPMELAVHHKNANKEWFDQYL